MGEDPLDMAYSKMKLKVFFMDGEQDEFRADVSPVEFNPYNFRSLHEFVVASYGSAVDPNYVYNFMGFVNPNYQNEPKWKPNPEAVARKKAEEETKANSYRYEGINFRKTENLNNEELIKVIRQALADKYPYAKLSVRQDNRGTGPGSIDVKILDIGFNPFNDEYKAWLKEGNTTYGTWDRDDYNRIRSYYTPKALKVRDDMKMILSSYNFDDSDSQTDYFHRRFYGDVEMDERNHLKLYMSETAMAQGIFKNDAETKEWEAKRKAKREEKKKDFVYSYGDVVVYTVNWRGIGEKDEYCLISKVPNGESSFSLDYDVWVLREAKTPEALKKAMNDEAELKQSRYQKSKRKKFIGVVYINGSPYIKYQYLENVRMSSIRPIEGNYTHWLKEEQAAKNAPKPPKPEPKPKPVKTETAKVPTVAKATLPSSTSNADVEISRNLAKNGIEVKFNKFPSDADRDFVKSKGFKWSSFSKVWYATYSDKLLKEVQEYFNPELKAKLESKPSSPTIEAGFYLAEKEYNAIAAIEKFPNPDVKIGMYQGQKRRIIKTGKITFEKVDKEKSDWYRIPIGGYIARSSTGFFPNELIAGVVNKMYSSETELGKRTGFVARTANLGTSSVGITNLEETAKILRENNFEVIVPKPELNKALALKIAIAKAKIAIALAVK